MQYIKVKFNAWDRKTYTYHFDGNQRLEVGDTVEVTTPREGPKQVTVDGVTDVQPHFVTKPINRVVARNRTPERLAEESDVVPDPHPEDNFGDIS